MSVYRTPSFASLTTAWGGVVLASCVPAATAGATSIGSAFVGEAPQELVLEFQHAFRVGPQGCGRAAEHRSVPGVVQVPHLAAQVFVGQLSWWDPMCGHAFTGTPLH